MPIAIATTTPPLATSSIAARTTPEEEQRLARLAEYGVLDSAAERDFDELTQLAAQICEVPIALISLVDEHRQWFKACVGLEITETSRDVSFCAHALHQSELLIVPDATKDPRFSDNPLVTGAPYIRFYAGAPLRTPEGQVLGALCVVDRVQRELTPAQGAALSTLSRQVMAQLDLRLRSRELAAHRRLLDAVTTGSTDAVFVKDRKGRYLFFNRAAADFVQLPLSEVLGKDDCEIFGSEWAAPIMARDRSIMESGVAGTEEEAVVLAGVEHTFLAMKAPSRDEHGVVNGIIGISRDITDRKLAEASLRQAYEDLHQSQQIVVQQERLRALGEMASGVAHDINNAICPVSIYTAVLLKTEPGLSPQAREYLEIIKQAAKGVGDTISRLRTFSDDRENSGIFCPMNLAEIIAEVVALTRPRWRDMAQEHGAIIDLQSEIEPGLPAIVGASHELSEAFINLIFNAVDALPAGGEITVRAFVTRGGPAASPQVCVEFTDTGSGMDAETRRRCLEPFFTTKGQRGSGLGLAIVCGILRRHDAQLAIDSAPGSGTTIRVHFPIAPTPVPSAAPTTESAPVPARKILLADDDSILLRALQSAFEMEGHRPHGVGGGLAALDAFRASLAEGAPFEIVFTDLGMPGVDGRKVAEGVKALSPTTPVVLLTGWGHGMQASGEIPSGVDRVLGKPATPDDLIAALDLCMAGSIGVATR